MASHYVKECVSPASFHARGFGPYDETGRTTFGQALKTTLWNIAIRHKKLKV